MYSYNAFQLFSTCVCLYVTFCNIFLIIFIGLLGISYLQSRFRMEILPDLIRISFYSNRTNVRIYVDGIEQTKLEQIECKLKPKISNGGFFFYGRNCITFLFLYLVTAIETFLIRNNLFSFISVELGHDQTMQLKSKIQWFDTCLLPKDDVNQPFSLAEPDKDVILIH